MDLRERVIELSARITALRCEIGELEKKRAELEAMEKELDSVLIQPTQVPVNLFGAPISANGTGSITGRITKMLKESPEDEFTAGDIHQVLGDVKLPSLRSALARLADEETIERAGRGTYRAKKE
jgi:hypothetical protein